MEKAINNYTINSEEVNISNSEVHIHSGLSTDDKINNAMNLLEVHKDYEKAEELFRTATKESPDNYLSWLGVFRAKTKDCTFVNCNDPELQELLDSAVKVVDEEHKSDVLSACEEYKKICSLYNESIELAQKIEKKKKNLNGAFSGLLIPAIMIGIIGVFVIYGGEYLGAAALLMIFSGILLIASIAVKVTQVNSTKELNQRNLEIGAEFKTIGKKMSKLMSPNKN